VVEGRAGAFITGVEGVERDDVDVNGRLADPEIRAPRRSSMDEDIVCHDHWWNRNWMEDIFSLKALDCYLLAWWAMTGFKGSEKEAKGKVSGLYAMLAIVSTLIVVEE
jgi:hypothetical protein